MKSYRDHGCHHRSPPSQWQELIRRQAGRVTRTRQLLLEALLRLRCPSTPKQIAEAVGRRTCDLATVYRCMTLFEQMGLVHRVDFGDGLARFEIADDDPSGHHHHHLLCRQCDRIVKLDDCILGEVESSLASHYGFVEIQHRLEFFGICPDCQQARRRPSP
ncbi:MAG TPA: transcriptional repressor [Candidatus Paceibacterota bacterium]|nr:transcriptional repressor [Verrucomicrobiota bacterium]HRY51330.1 transcriptional repressor [Candidatus Paceibacterota bacterium]HSA00859.1 transcriptional repressor [Candidatus Paceibacterota bacterium]